MNKAAADFFNSLPSEAETEKDFDFLGEPQEQETTEPVKAPTAVEEEKEETDIEKEEERKKPLRSERRAEKTTDYLRAQLQEEREARIRMEERIEALSRAEKKAVDPDIKRLLTDVKDPEEASEIFDSILSKMRQDLRQEAREEFVAAQKEGDAEVNAIHAQIEESLEAIEDRYGVDLTNDTDTRNKFIDFVGSIAPEDSDALPNMRTAWQLFQSTRKAAPAQTERKAAISSRSMTRSLQTRPEGKDIKPISFDRLDRTGAWDKIKAGLLGNN